MEKWKNSNVEKWKSEKFTIFFVYVNIFKRTHGPYVNISKHFADHLPTPNCKRNLWRLPKCYLVRFVDSFSWKKNIFDHFRFDLKCNKGNNKKVTFSNKKKKIQLQFDKNSPRHFSNSIEYFLWPNCSYEYYHHLIIWQLT